MQLVGLKGIHWTQTFPLVGSEITIGREAGNTIACDGDSRVSRRHARLIPNGLTYAVEDLGSSNGTFVNGVRISALASLSPGDEIRIGGQSYRFEADTPTVAPPPVMGAPPQRPKEVSRGEQAKGGWTRGTERIYGGQQGGLSDMGGCAVPRFDLPDLSGCLRVLLLLLIALVVIMLLAGLLMLIGSGIASLGGIGGHHGGSAPPTSSGGGATGGSGGGGDSGGGQPEQTTTGIYVRSVKVVQIWPSDAQPGVPRAFVTWVNQTDGPVHKIWARVRSLAANGQVLATAEDVVIYDGKPVDAGLEHADGQTLREGFLPPGRSPPSTVKVEVTRYQ